MKLINPDKLKEIISEKIPRKFGRWDRMIPVCEWETFIRDIIDNAPTIKTFTLADIEERPQGEWINRRIIAKDRSFDMVVCSNCQTEFSWDAETGVSMDNYNTCPNCGADMRGDKHA